MAIQISPLTPLGRTAARIEEVVPRRESQIRFASRVRGMDGLQLRQYRLYYTAVRPTPWMKAEWHTEFFRRCELRICYPWSAREDPFETEEMMVEDYEDLTKALHHRQLDQSTTDMIARATDEEATLEDDDAGECVWLVIPLEPVVSHV